MEQNQIHLFAFFKELICNELLLMLAYSFEARCVINYILCIVELPLMFEVETFCVLV